MINEENEPNTQKINDSVYLEELLEGKINLTKNTKNEDLLKYLKVNI